MKYKIAEAPNAVALQTRVNDAIQEGWKPIGGVGVTCVEIQADTPLQGTIDECFYQAMVNETET